MVDGQNKENYCADLVRKLDHDRYLSTLFAPAPKRHHLLSLYAFNIEIARIREIVSEPALGEMRLQWWRDTIAALYEGNPGDHPVSQGLADAIKAGDLPQSAFQNLIDARVFDLYDDPMPTLNDLEGYLGETSSVLIILAAPTVRWNCLPGWFTELIRTYTRMVMCNLTPSHPIALSISCSLGPISLAVMKWTHTLL